MCFAYLRKGKKTSVVRAERMRGRGMINNLECEWREAQEEDRLGNL